VRHTSQLFQEQFGRVTKMEQIQFGVTLKICAIGEAGRKGSGSRAGAGSFPCLAIPLYCLQILHTNNTLATFRPRANVIRDDGIL
jgi:hypothetical protein